MKLRYNHKLALIVIIHIILGLGKMNFAQEFLTKNEGFYKTNDNSSIKSLVDADIAEYQLHQTQKFNNTESNFSLSKLHHIKTNVPDDDDDGMPNDWETANGLNPNDPTDAWADPDQDQVINLFEYQLNSNPQNPASPQSIDVTEGENIEDAIDNTPSGYLIRIQGGVYNVNYTTFLPTTIMIQGGWNSDFTVRDLENTPTVFDGQSVEEVLYFSFNSDTNSVILDGLTLINGSGNFGALNMISNGTSIMKWSVMNCRIINSESSSFFGGVFSIIHWGYSQSDVFIVKTVIANNMSSGINNQTTDSSSGRWKIINSDITDNQSEDTDEGYGIESFTLDSGELNINLKNTILWGNQNTDLDFSRSAIVNAEYSDVGTVDTARGAVYNPGAGMINEDPLFIDAENNNFYLSEESPCMDAGIDVGFPFLGNAPDIGALESDGAVSVEHISGKIPHRFFLQQNYPNPFNPTTTFSFNLPIKSFVTLKVFGLLGKEVATIISEDMPAGSYSRQWNAVDVPSGVYFYRLEAGSFTQTKKLVLLK